MRFGHRWLFLGMMLVGVTVNRWTIAEEIELPSRAQQLERLNSETFDLVVIGGGATGAGIAVDAATRGLSVALVERDDFAAGTSSRSTKLVHGGVRYLEKAVKGFDRAQLDLVREALRERATVLKIAPNLTRKVPLVTPIYSWIQLPYYWVGLKLYDWLSGKRGLSSSTYMSRESVLKQFPHLKADGLKGAVVYYDGQFDDARLNSLLVLTAAYHGAAVGNHIEVVDLIKEGRAISGVVARDILTDRAIEVRGRCVINATGPFADAIRKIDDPDASNMLAPSVGSHLVLDAQLCPDDAGLLIPHTTDGRVLFMLPWQGGTLAGTTDEPHAIEPNPLPSEHEVDFILEQLSHYMETKLDRSHLRASWAGLRPLVKGSGNGSTADLVRDHVITTSSSGMITIVGGKWTTYRKMAEEAVDRAIAEANLSVQRRCQTPRVQVVGATDALHTVALELAAQYRLPSDVSRHLVEAYGTRAFTVVDGVTKEGLQRIAPDHPFIWAEVDYAVKHEYACTVVDVLARRLRMAFVDTDATRKAIPGVASKMAGLLRWDDTRRLSEEQAAQKYLG